MATFDCAPYGHHPYGYLFKPSRTFTARGHDCCERCGTTVYPGQSAQYVNNKFGHAIDSISYCNGIYTLRCINGGSVHYSEAYLMGGCIDVPTPVKKEKKMSIEACIKLAEETLASLREKKEKIDAWGKDSDYPNASVILYQDSSGYKRTAVKQSADVWAVGAQRYTWANLVENILLDCSEVWFATEWERM